LRLALVLWKGDIGGAEVLSVTLAEQLRRRGVEATVVFIEGSEPLGSRLDELGLPHRTVGLRRGRHILRHPVRYAREVAQAGPDGALLVTCGYMGGALRLGGYRAPIVAVEHGDVLYEKRRRPLRWCARRAGAWADDVEVGVSEFIVGWLTAEPHAKEVRCIYNGIDLEVPGTPAAQPGESGGRPDRCALAFAGRLVFGKGADYLLQALAATATSAQTPLTIAGEGPERARLESLARELGLANSVTFAGLAHEMPRFWRQCDVAVVPSAEFVEACPMVPLEAMAAGKPVVATENGGLPELVVDGETGTLVPPEDPAALARAIDRYATDGELRRRHGDSGRRRALEMFGIGRCADEYLELFRRAAAAQNR
jgi:glycosyltransferase involved in cell wall biosynthesis